MRAIPAAAGMVAALCCVVGAWAENGLDERSPFGIVCPWTDINQTGARWTRCGAGATELVNWPGMEPVKGAIDFRKADAEWDGWDTKEKLFPVPILGYTAPWASRIAGKADQPPKDLADWERWVNACAEHFRGKVRFWEVWNEPNIEFFNGSMTDYANLLKTASVGVRRADPTAAVLFGGTAGVDLEFLRRTYELGCGPYWDVMSVHPYQWGTTFNDGWFTEKLTNLRALMDSFGDRDKRIWLTELGWATSDKAITPEIQARLLVQAYVTSLSLQHLGVDKVFWFCVKDWGGPGYGIYNDDSSKKPAWFAYQTMTRQLAGRPYMGKVAVEGMRCHAFGPSATEKDAVVAIWAPGLEDVVGKLSVPEGEYQAVGISGEARTLKSDGSLVLQARPAAQYVHLPLATAQKLAVMTDRRDYPWPDPQAQERPLSWATVVSQPMTERMWLIPGRKTAVRVLVHNGQDAAGQAVITVRLGDGRPAQTRGSVGADETRELTAMVDCPPQTRLGLCDLTVTGTVGRETLLPVTDKVRIATGPTVEFVANSHIERSTYLQPGAKCGCSESTRFGSEWTYKLDVPKAGEALVTMDVGAHMAQEWSVTWSQDGKSWQPLLEGRSWRETHEGRIARLERGSLYLLCKGTDEQVGRVVVTFPE